MNIGFFFGLIQLTGGGTGSTAYDGTSPTPSFVPFQKGAASAQYQVALWPVYVAGIAAVLSIAGFA
jgi:hypothetical protein